MTGASTHPPSTATVEWPALPAQQEHAPEPSETYTATRAMLLDGIRYSKSEGFRHLKFFDEVQQKWDTIAPFLAIRLFKLGMPLEEVRSIIDEVGPMITEHEQSYAKPVGQATVGRVVAPPAERAPVPSVAAADVPPPPPRFIDGKSLAAGDRDD